MMMLLPYQEAQQDTVQLKIIPAKDSVMLKSDSASISKNTHPGDSVPHRIKISTPKAFQEITDTISVCSRNSIEDVTFYDSGNLINRINSGHIDNFPFLFTVKNRQIEKEAKVYLVKHLRAGDEIPSRSIHNDWSTLIILSAALMFSMVRKSSVNLVQGVERFFLFRGISIPSSRDLGGVFSLESTIKNFISFLVLGLFCYSAAFYYDVVPSSISGIIFWIISVFIIMTAVTLRHLVCLVAGAISGEREVFTEYLINIYQFYRFSALMIFVVTVLISYTTIFPVKSYFNTAVIILATLYLLRAIRLFIIFVNKNISLFYLILYLCALEILPVLILVKYISGLV